MDRMYAPQLRIYDATRRWYLLGRNTMLRNIQPSPGESVLEIGCGTGRNLLWLAARHPSVRVLGADISPVMLSAATSSALARGLAGRLTLAAVAAESLDVRRAFGCDHVDHVVFSYSLSMMPDWQAALGRGFEALRPGGRLHAVDFWDLGDWPAAARVGMRRWLSLFGVHCSTERCNHVVDRARAHGSHVAITPIAGRYAWWLCATRQAAAERQ
jgi:S-adenosylmethionine-diacylgycerolhomoserine-N-methlytransferase